MLTLNAEICFDTPEANPNALSHELSTDIILRPAINFGNDILLSGTLITDKNDGFLYRGKKYQLVIEMPTVEGEVFERIKALVVKDNLFMIQLASRVIGQGKIIDYLYE